MNITMTGTPFEWKRHSRKAFCPHCHSSQWTVDGRMPRDHDRLDGRVCQKAIVFGELWKDSAAKGAPSH
jgi:hypothetical protein